MLLRLSSFPSLQKYYLLHALSAMEYDKLKAHCQGCMLKLFSPVEAFMHSFNDNITYMNLPPRPILVTMAYCTVSKSVIDRRLPNNWIL